MYFNGSFHPDTHLESYRRKMERVLRQVLESNGVIAHLKVAAKFADGILELTIDTDPRALKFIWMDGR